MQLKIQGYIEEHQKTVQNFAQNKLGIIEETVELIKNVFDNNGTIYLCGNGGSMADCQHIAGELIGKYCKKRRPLPAITLSTDAGVTTCISNDFDYSDIFSRQLEALGKDGDLLWAISTSGTSANVVAAAKTAKEKNIKVIAFTGKPNSPLEDISDICLCAESEKTNHSQEVHEIAYHMICELIDEDY